MPVGVRAVTGERAGRLAWVSAEVFGTDSLVTGSRVVVSNGAGEWLGEVVVAPERLLESPPLTGLPSIVRLAREGDGWPEAPDRAGRTLLDSLALSPELLTPARD